MRTLALALVGLLSVACVGEGSLDGDDGESSLASIGSEGQGNISLEWSIFVGDSPQSCVSAGADSLEPESEREQRIKARNRIDPALRLACRVHPTADLTVRASYW